MNARRAWLAAGLGCLALCCYALACQLALPSGDVCYAEHVVPLVKRDCALCHENGEYGVKLVGRESDYDELARYMLPAAGAQSPIVTWADGYNLHPVIWGPQSAERTMIIAWIDEGGQRDCFDRARYGECRGAHDCQELSCICQGGQVETGQLCAVDEESGRGSCATAETCSEARFGLCRAPDAGPATRDGGPADARPAADAQPGVVSFAKQITPLNRTDCARCHALGQWNVKITGTVADYPEVMRYVDPRDPAARNGYLWWAAGGGKHPVLWLVGGSKYKLFHEWVRQGAKNN